MSDDVYELVFRIAEALETPVVILALLALAFVVVELGAFLTELFHRRGRTLAGLTRAAGEARARLDDDDRAGAESRLAPYAWNPAMAAVLSVIAAEAGRPGAEPRILKQLADFDFGRQKRLGRTRLLVRAGPALGLMGTLIPLSPALEGLADGNVTALTDNLRLAFSITVLGLLVGAVSFGLALVRDRIYAQDYSDLEYVAAVLTADEVHEPVEPVTP